MSEMRKHFEARLEAFGPNLPNDFMLKYGRDYSFGPKTFTGPRYEAKACFMNATHLALADRSLTYVEGFVAIHGVPLAHAWCADADGNVVDPTIIDVGQVVGYYGVPLNTEYVRRAVKLNKMYGVLDYFYAGKTAPKLYELGLEEGQRWLLDQKRAIKRKPRKVVA